MSELKHTPGPWYTGCMTDKESQCNCRSILSEGMAGSIAQISIHNGIERIADGCNDCPPLGEAIANAHLIAAAPDLLDALEEARGIVSDQTILHLGEGHRPLYPELLGRIDNIINRARGKQS